MSRPKKQAVDYFPHYCQHKKTMFILEQRYGNDGYAFWFKLLELLGSTDNHYLDLNDATAWEFLQAKTRLGDSLCEEILDLLARLGAIDAQLWCARVVWSQNFVDGLEPVYKNRRVETPSKPSFYIEKPCAVDVSTQKTPQSKVKESKVKESNTCAPESASQPEPLLANKNSGRATSQEPAPNGEAVQKSAGHDPKGDSGEPRATTPFTSKRQEDKFEQFWAAYPKKRSKGQAEKTWVKINPDEQLLEAILARLEQAKTSGDWVKDDGRYIPYPSTWLNAKGWEDEGEVEINTNSRGDPNPKSNKYADIYLT